MRLIYERAYFIGNAFSTAAYFRERTTFARVRYKSKSISMVFIRKSAGIIDVAFATYERLRFSDPLEYCVGTSQSFFVLLVLADLERP